MAATPASRISRLLDQQRLQLAPKVGSAKKATTIKSHHNVVGLPDTLHLKLLEPLPELFKDEVRELGVALGLPREMVYRPATIEWE